MVGGLLGEYGEPGSRRVVVVICDLASVGLAEAIGELDPAVEVLAFVRAAEGETIEDRSGSNVRFGTGHNARSRLLQVAELSCAPCLVVEFDSQPGRENRAAFANFFGVLSDGGRYVHLDADAPSPQAIASREPMTVRDLAAWCVEHRGSVSEADGPWATELVRSLGDVIEDGDLTVIGKRGDHVFKVHLEEMEAVGEARWGAEWAETIVRHEPYEYEMPGKLVLANTGPITAKRRHIEVPVRVLRRHTDVVLSRRMLLRRENIALTESFHHPHQLGLKHPRLHDIHRMIARDPTPNPPRDLEGAYFLLDTNYPSHFGHITTEVLGMMWGWLELRRRGIEARPIVSAYAHRPEPPGYQFEIFEAFGIAREDVEVVVGEDVVRIPELYTATQQMESPRWIDRDLAQIWAHLGAALREKAAAAGETGLQADRIFISRRHGPKRNCMNTEEIEEYFRSRGFSIYFPEDHGYLHQVQTFAGAKRIAGLGGSGMFNMMFAPQAKILVLTSDGYAATNELLLAAANGNDLTYVWGPAETRPIKMGRHDKASFRANFSIDLDAHRSTLQRFTRKSIFGR